MSTPLQEFISNAREAESIEDERLIITTELADMRTLIRECEIDRKPNIIAKLIYLSITGESTQWGQIDAVGLMSSDRISFKRLGYLAVQTLFDESSELLVLITQTLHRDLSSGNPLVQAFPLAFIANMGTTEMCQSVYPDVERLTGSAHPGIVKRAGIAAVKIVIKLPDLAASFKKALTRLLSNTKHAVVASGVILAIEMMKADNSFAGSWKHFAKPFTQLLKTLSHSRPTAEFRMAIFNDPFLQIKTMQLLGMLKVPSDDLDEALTFLVTTVDVRRNTGRTLLFQAVETIGLTAKKPSLCGLAFNQIGRLLSHKEPNVLYSVLSVFSKIIYHGSEILDRSSRDSLALQRYKSLIVHCLGHRDPSIRRRALDVVSALVDEANVESLVPEIIEYLHLADADFRTEMIVKIYSAVQRFAPTPMWHFDTVHSLLIDSGNYVGNDILSSFCKLIATNDEVRNHALPLLYNTMCGYSGNQALVKVAAWVLGEYLMDFTSLKNKVISIKNNRNDRNDENNRNNRNDENNQNNRNDGYNLNDGNNLNVLGNDNEGTIVETMLKIMKMPQTQVETKCYLITGATKIAARMNSIEKVVEDFRVLMKDNNIEIQQRTGEMYRLLQQPELWEEMLAPPDFKKNDSSHSQQITAKIFVQQNSIVTPPSSQPSSSAPSLIDIDSISTNTNNNNTNNINNNNTNNNNTNNINNNFSNNSSAKNVHKDSLIDDLLDFGSTNSNQQQNQQQNSQNENVLQKFKPPANSVEAIKAADFVVYFEIQKNPTNQNQMAIRTTIVNTGDQPLKNFNIQYGVPVGWVVRTQPLNNAVLNPRGQSPIQQILYLENKGNSPLMMKTHTTYLFGCQPLMSDDTVKPIF